MTFGHQDRLDARLVSRSLGLVGVFALLIALLPLAGGASAAHRANTTELSASDATAASIEWSEATFSSATHAAVGRDDKFPDNLASSVIQGRLDAPLLLTDNNSLDAGVLSELQRLGVVDVHVLGGTAAISDSVVDKLRSEGFQVHRDSGVTRIETAIDIASTHAADATEGLLVRAFGSPGGDETQAWADALAAGGWAADKDIPVFLTQTEKLNDNLEAYLQGSNVRTITIVGGSSAVSPVVAAELTAMGITVNRVAGANRFDTAVEVAEARGFASAADADKVLLVEGQDTNAWASGFAAAAHSGMQDAPVILSNGANVPPESDAWLSPGGPSTALVCGPFVTDAACSEAADHLDKLAAPTLTLDSSSVARGGNLQGQLADAQHVKSLAVSGACVTNQTVSRDASGNFTVPVRADAATGDCTLTFTITYTDDSTDTVTRTITVTAPATVTARPELVSAQLVSLTTPSQVTGQNPQGTKIRYTFDEELGTFGGLAPVANRFHAYSAENVRFTGTDFTVDSGNRSVTVRFNDLETQAEYDALTMATVARDAVFDPQGNGSTEGDAPIGTSGSTTTGQAGTTSAPDLVRVENFRDAFQVGQTAVNFVFDQNAFRTTGVSAGDFKLVMVDGSEIVCTAPASGSTTPSGQTNVGGEGTTTFTVVCTNPGGTPGSVAGTAITASNVARGVVEANAVAATSAQAAAPGTADQNPLHAEDVSPTITTPRPDLVSATFQPGAGTAVDSVVYTFDQAVTATALTLFNVYKTDGTEVAAVAPQTATINPQNTSQVSVTYPNGTLRDAVGASAEEGAVTGSGGVNRDDEVGVANTQTTTRTPGSTTGPNLTGVTIDRGTDQFGNTTDYRATFTFDEPIDGATDVAARFHLYLANGTRLDGVTCDRVAAVGAPAGTTGENQVRCTVLNVAGGGAATSDQVGSAVLGTVEFDAVDDLQGQPATEGARVASGSTGTPQP